MSDMGGGGGSDGRNSTEVSDMGGGGGLMEGTAQK